MFQYVIRRLLLMIPTFIGTTLMVFVILQVAPDGPFERAVRQLKEATGSGGEGYTVPRGNNIGGNKITPELLEEMRMQFGLDKPIIVRYLIWLGVYPKEVQSKRLSINEEFRETVHSIEINQILILIHLIVDMIQIIKYTKIDHLKHQVLVQILKMKIIIN